MSKRYCASSKCRKTGICEYDTNNCYYLYDPANYAEEHRWKGEGPPPAKWLAPDGTTVYRSYADYCDD